jgi:hypothetical protein
VPNAYHRRPPRPDAQQTVKPRLPGLVERRSCLVQEEQRRRRQKNSGERKSLLFTKRQPLTPVVDRI